MSVPLPAFRRVRLTQQCVIHPQDKGGNYLPCASEDWVLFVSLAADGEKIILRTEHLCLPIKPGGALLLPPNVCHELPFVQAPCLMLGFSAADDGQAVFEFPQLQGTPAWMFLLLLYSEQTTATARTPLLEALLMQMAPMAHGFELCAPDAAFSLATEVLQHLNLCFAEELSLTELTNRFHVSTSHMIHMFKAQFGPNDAITREQLTAILYRYADHLGLDTDTGFIPDKYYDFSDYQSVSRYATNAMSWCVNKGIVSGSDGKLNPHGTATRAEVATMLMNAENILDANEPTEPETPVSPDGQPVPDDTDNETADDNQTVTDEISLRPIGKSAVDEYGGYWDYDLSNATFDAINDLREENGLPRLTYSLKVQEWADTRSREIWIVDERDGDISHTRPDGSVFASVGYGCNAENALIGLITTNAQENLNKWYGSQGHRENMLNTRSKTTAVSAYVQGEKVYALQLFDKLTITELNNR